MHHSIAIPNKKMQDNSRIYSIYLNSEYLDYLTEELVILSIVNNWGQERRLSNLMIKSWWYLLKMGRLLDIISLLCKDLWIIGWLINSIRIFIVMLELITRYMSLMIRLSEKCQHYSRTLINYPQSLLQQVPYTWRYSQQQRANLQSSTP